jgi:hypothetical protein
MPAEQDSNSGFEEGPNGMTSEGKDCHFFAMVFPSRNSGTL